MPKVSVIMPTYNRSWIIEKAIDSVLNQTFNNFELIIIDDASTDDTFQKIKKFKDKRVIIHKLKDNKGASAARNKGIQIAKGEVIAYLDSDNVWYPSYLEVMLEELTDFYIMAYSGQNTFLVGGKKNNLKIIGRKVRNFSYNPLTLSKSNYIDINCAVHKKIIFDEIGFFDENLKTLEDWDFFARVAINYPFKIKHVDQVLGEYYFFLKNTASTIENSILSDQMLLYKYDLATHKGDRGLVIKRINELKKNR